MEQIGLETADNKTTKVYAHATKLDTNLLKT